MKATFTIETVTLTKNQTQIRLTAKENQSIPAGSMMPGLLKTGCLELVMAMEEFDEQDIRPGMEFVLSVEPVLCAEAQAEVDFWEGWDSADREIRSLEIMLNEELAKS